MTPISDHADYIVDAPHYNGFFTRVFQSSNTTTGPWQFLPYIAGGADDSTSDDGDGDGDQGDQNTDDATGGDEGTTPDADKKFTQDDVNKLIAKEKSKALRGKLDAKEFGFETRKELDDFIKAQKDKTAEQQTEEEKAKQKAIDDAKEAAKTEILDKSRRLALRAEFKVSAYEAGVPKTAVEDAFLLAQTLDEWQDVEVDDEGSIKGLDETFFEALKEAKPFLFPEPKDEDEQGERKTTNIGQRSGGSKGKSSNQDEELRNKYAALRNV